ncbi:hypothetical protein CRG98_017240 [Punica granatum]|nr:hypothetical protein CRG98_017240 [Punica granatum]
MNVVAICLVATSLAAAGVWSPSPSPTPRPHTHPPDINNDAVIVKDGHRTIVVEYDQDGHPNTKVSISPDTTSLSASSSNKEARARDKDDNLAREEEDSDQKLHESGHGPGFAAKELICDAYGKCKHVISSTLGKARDEAAATVHEIGREAGEAKEFVSREAHDAKEHTKEKFEGARDEAREVKESVVQRAHDAKERFEGAKEGAKESLSQGAHYVEEQLDRAKNAAKEAKEDAKKTIGETVRSLSEAAEKGRRAKETAKGRVKAGPSKIKEMGYKLLASRSLMPTSLMGLVNLLGFAVAYGMCTWVTFISSRVLAKTLPRQQFALVQSKLYPIYFRAMAYSIGGSLLGHMFSHQRRLFSSNPEMLQNYNLLASLLMVCFNMLYLEPRATKVMFERMKLEKEEGRGREFFGEELRVGVGVGVGGRQTNESSPAGEAPASTAPTAAGTAVASPVADSAEEAALRARVAKLNERLKSLNSYSSLLNILTLMALSWHLVYLGQRVSPTC